MENITVSGMKEINQKLGHIERHLEDIAKSLSTLTKIANRQCPKVTLTRDDSIVRMSIDHEDLLEEDEDEMS